MFLMRRGDWRWGRGYIRVWGDGTRAEGGVSDIIVSYHRGRSLDNTGSRVQVEFFFFLSWLGLLTVLEILKSTVSSNASNSKKNENPFVLYICVKFMVQS